MDEPLTQADKLALVKDKLPGISDEKALDIVHMTDWAIEHEDFLRAHYLDFLATTGEFMTYTDFVVGTWEIVGKGMAGMN